MQFPVRGWAGRSINKKEQEMKNPEEATAPIVETAADRLAAAQATIKARGDQKRQYETGFDNADDYNQWLLLERLREATLSLRRTPDPLHFPLVA